MKQSGIIATGLLTLVMLVGAAIDGRDCTDFAFPRRMIQFALDQAGEGGEIHAATGVYGGVVDDHDGLAQAKTATIQGGSPAFAELPDSTTIQVTVLDAQGRGLYFTGYDLIGYITSTLEGSYITNGLPFAAFLAAMLVGVSVRSLKRTFRRQKSREFEWAMAQELFNHQESLREQLGSGPRAWQEPVRQLLADARVGGEDVPLMLGDVSISCPTFAIVGDTAYYTFTTDPDRARGNRFARWRNWRDRVISLDTTVSPFARVDAQVLWGHLAARKQEGFVLSRRNMAWHLIVRRRGGK